MRSSLRTMKSSTAKEDVDDDVVHIIECSAKTYKTIIIIGIDDCPTCNNGSYIHSNGASSARFSISINKPLIFGNAVIPKPQQSTNTWWLKNSFHNFEKHIPKN